MNNTILHHDITFLKSQTVHAPTLTTSIKYLSNHPQINTHHINIHLNHALHKIINNPRLIGNVHLPLLNSHLHLMMMAIQSLLFINIQFLIVNKLKKLLLICNQRFKNLEEQITQRINQLKHSKCNSKSTPKNIYIKMSQKPIMKFKILNNNSSNNSNKTN